MKDDLIERLRLYRAVWGEEPCIAPHSTSAPGYTTGRVIREANEAADEIERLRSAIQAYLDGNYDHPRAHRPGKCRHGVWFYDECGSCADEHFTAALAPTRLPAKPDDTTPTPTRPSASGRDEGERV